MPGGNIELTLRNIPAGPQGTQITMPDRKPQGRPKKFPASIGTNSIKLTLTDQTVVEPAIALTIIAEPNIAEPTIAEPTVSKSTIAELTSTEIMETTFSKLVPTEVTQSTLAEAASPMAPEPSLAKPAPVVSRYRPQRLMACRNHITYLCCARC